MMSTWVTGATLWSLVLFSGVRGNILTDLLTGAKSQDVNNTVTQSTPGPFLTTPGNMCTSYQCGCYKGEPPKKIDCSYRKISILNRLALPREVYEISLSGNNLSKIFDTYFYAGPGLHVLDLSHNPIDFVAITSFQMFTQLNRLSLSHNRLTSLDEQVFRGLGQLQSLDLSYNRLSSLYPKDFDYLENLNELNLAHNPLLEFNGNAFSKLTSLNKLNIQSTGITSFRTTDFDSLTNLKWLDISGNGFQNVPLKGLHKLSQLSYLDLSRNPIRTIPPYSFYNLTSLRSLILRYMVDLVSVEAHAFGDVASLKIVDFSFSHMLARIDAKAFALNSSDAKIELDEFYARQTALETLSQFLLNWDYVNKVDFGENNWRCDCLLEWMPHIVRRDALDGKLRCGSPKSLEGRLIVKLNPGDFQCLDSVSLDHPSWREVNVAMKVALGLLITITIALAAVILTLLFFRIRAQPHMYRSLKQRLGYATED
ncbi:tsukushi [Ixodes scapularis]